MGEGWEWGQWWEFLALDFCFNTWKKFRVLEVSKVARTVLSLKTFSPRLGTAQWGSSDGVLGSDGSQRRWMTPDRPSDLTGCCCLVS